MKNEKWYQNTAIMTLVGTFLGAAIGFAGTVYASQVKLNEVELQHSYEVEENNLDKKNDIYIDMIQSIYSLQQMNDGLIESDLAAFKSKSYAILAEARIYCSDESVELYNQFLKKFFETKGIYDGQLVDNELIPAIRKELGITE